MEKLPLEQEIERMTQMKIKLSNDIMLIEGKKRRNMDQICMLKEDEIQSNSIKVHLAYQIEEYQYQQDQVHNNNIDFYHINKLVKNEKLLTLESMKHGIYE
jgi:molybdopterin-guanine dinucleotide biosynthesis protein